MADETDLIEVIFEGLSEAAAVELAAAFSPGLGMPTAETGLVEVELPSLALTPEWQVDGVHLRVLRYEPATYDVELNFEVSGVPRALRGELGAVLQQFATATVGELEVPSYYGGLEPAVDEETRLFTGASEVGPWALE